MGILIIIAAAFGSALGQYLPEKVIAAIYGALAESQHRRVWRRAIRDLIEDEVNAALKQNDIDEVVRKEYMKRLKKHLKQEIRNRFDHALQGRL